MSLEIRIGPQDIAGEFFESLDDAETTISAVTNAQTFAVGNITPFVGWEGERIQVGKDTGIISSITGSAITLTHPLALVPEVGQLVRFYRVFYTRYKDSRFPIKFQLDRRTGGESGNVVSQEIVLVDHDGKMCIPKTGWRLNIYEGSTPLDPPPVIFGGSIVAVRERVIAKARNGELVKGYALTCKGFQHEADLAGIEEEPAVNVNAGQYLRRLAQKYTNLALSIDITNSPTVEFIRLQNYRRFSDVGRDLAALWPGGEFYIENEADQGTAVFQRRVSSEAPFRLTSALLEKVGPEKLTITQDDSNTWNVVRLPFYQLQRREPDFFVQSTVTDNAFLKTSVTLNGQPANIDETTLLFDDFSDGSLQSGFIEDDITNPSPPSGFTQSDGYLVEGEINGVRGLHLLGGATASLGDIARTSDPAVAQPVTAAERQMLYAQEVVINTLGEAVLCGIIDQTSISTTTTSGATTTSIPVVSVANLAVGDRLTINSQKTYITNISSLTLTVSPALSGAPSTGTTVTLHRMARSRIKWGLYLNGAGDLKYLKNGVETAFSSPRTYTTATYSFRLFFQCFETTIASGVSSTGCTLSDATSFTTGDVVEIFTEGSRKPPEQRVITKSGSNITYSATSSTPEVGYRVRTLPKLVVQVKGGSYGVITGRDWTTIHTEANTWATAVNQTIRLGALVAMQKDLVATIPLFQLKDPPGVTGNIGSRYLHIGTQDIDSSEPDIDCIVRKLGSHYQLDFFPDTKALWSSGSTLELRYFEKFRFDLEEVDYQGLQETAIQRGYTVTGTETQADLLKLGGKTLDTIELLPNPITIFEANNQSKSILEAVKNSAFTLELEANTGLVSIPQPGQTLRSEIAGIPDLEIQRVELEEVPGWEIASGGYSQQGWNVRITAGTVNRLDDILLSRKLKNNSRLVIDDGVNADTFTLIQKSSLNESADAVDAWNTATCTSQTRKLQTGSAKTKIKCLLMPYTPPGGGFSYDFSQSSNSFYLATL